MNTFFRTITWSSRPFSRLVKSANLSYFISENQASLFRCHRQAKISIARWSLKYGVQDHFRPLCWPRTCAGPLISVRGFRLSQPRFAGPLAIFLVKLAGPFSKVVKLAAVVGGRYFRKSWRNLSKHHRLNLSKGLTIIIGGFGGFCLGLYFFHLEETPVTNRTRFMPISQKQMEELAAREHKNLLEEFANNILPPYHPDHVRVFAVAKRLVMANQSKEMENLSWQVNVVDREEINAFVLPNGQIFLFTGMLKLLPNADSLAVVLGHEMSHVILQHAAEQVSLHGFINMFLVISLALVWAVLPSDLLAIGAHWLQNRILVILLHLPYSRKLEEEADEVGLNMAAKACFDVRESPMLWRRLALSRNTNETELPTWLSTHPTHDARAEKLEGLLPKAIQIRENCQCPPLPGVQCT